MNKACVAPRPHVNFPFLLFCSGWVYNCISRSTSRQVIYRTFECYVVTFLRKQNLVFVCRQGVVVLFNMVVVVKMQSGVFRARRSVRFASMLLKVDDTAVLIYYHGVLTGIYSLRVYFVRSHRVNTLFLRRLISCSSWGIILQWVL